MNLTPVESSHIAAIGYLEADRVLLVRYKDGSLYAIPGMPPSVWDAWLAAESKGRYLARIREPMIRITKGGNAENRIESEQAGAASTTAPLNVIDEDADKCCRKAFAQMRERSALEWETTGGITCGECGTTFRPQMVGPTRHWRIVPLFALHRRAQ